jgi:hypothetical protein
MASGYNASRFNLALACAAAGATAFALFAMPDAELRSGLDAIGFAQILSNGPTARLSIAATAPVLAFLLVWLTLRSCDPPVRQSGTETDEEEDNWPLSLLVAGHGSDTNPEDPFAALARGAERVDDCFVLARAQLEVAEIASAIGDRDDAVPEPLALLARLPRASHANNAVQKLDVGLVASEWPLPAGESEEEAEEMDDRLRHVLQDLKLVSRHG